MSAACTPSATGEKVTDNSAPPAAPATDAVVVTWRGAAKLTALSRWTAGRPQKWLVPDTPQDDSSAACSFLCRWEMS